MLEYNEKTKPAFEAPCRTRCPSDPQKYQGAIAADPRLTGVRFWTAQEAGPHPDCWQPGLYGGDLSEGFSHRLQS